MRAMALAPLLALIACSSKPQQRTEAPPVAEAPAPPAESPRITQLRPRPIEDAPEPPEPTIALPFRESLTVQSTGDEPRQRRRYAPASSTRLYTVSATLLARAITGDAAPAAPVKVPPFHETFALEASATSPLLQWRGDPIQVDGDATAAAPYVMRWKTLLAGRRARFSLDAQALPAELTFAEDPLRERSRPESDELSQRLLGWIVPLPEEPLGVGARWTAVVVLRQGLGVVKQTARYHLVEATAERLVLEVDLRRVAEEQRVQAPELPPGTSLELLALFRSVTGRLELSLQAPLPIAAELTIEARSHQRLTRADASSVEAISEDTGTLTLKSEPI
jgi:hypothetical protein